MHQNIYIYTLFTARKRGLGQGNISCLASWSHVPSGGICAWSHVPPMKYLSRRVCPGEGVSVQGRASLSRESLSGKTPVRAEVTEQVARAGGTYHIGMLSCLGNNSII